MPKAELHAGRRDREHRHRRPDDAALGGEEPSRRDGAWSIRRDYARVLAEMRANGNAVGYDDAASRSRPRCSRTPPQYDGAITNYLTSLDRRTAAREPQHVSGDVQPRVRQGAGPALRREPAPERRVLPRPRRRRPARSPTTTQLQGKELSYNNIADADAAWECVKTFDAPRLRDRQARQSVRRGDRRERARRVREGVQDRSDLGLRRHHRVQPRSRRRGGAKRWPSSSSKC